MYTLLCRITIIQDSLYLLQLLVGHVDLDDLDPVTVRIRSRKIIEDNRGSRNVPGPFFARVLSQR